MIRQDDHRLIIQDISLKLRDSLIHESFGVFNGVTEVDENGEVILT